MEPNWSRDILRAARCRDEGDEKRFLALVDQAAGHCTLDVARVLMKTFSDRPDHGTQECVVSVLASVADKDVTTALLEELPRLTKEAPEWADALIGEEVHFRPELLAATAACMPDEIKSALRKVLENPEFADFYPNAATIRF